MSFKSLVEAAFDIQANINDLTKQQFNQQRARLQNLDKRVAQIEAYYADLNNVESDND